LRRYRAADYNAARVHAFRLAVQFLTIVPVPGGEAPTPAQFGRAVAFFPVVGLLLGLFALLVDSLASLVWPSGVSTALTMAGLVVITGALHLDGLLDTCDGLFLWKPERRLEVMRDSRVGGFAVAGGLTLYLVKFAALASAVGPARAAALTLAPTLGRLGIVLALVSFPYVRTTGLGNSFKDNAQRWSLLVGAGVGLAAAAWFGPAGLGALVAAFIAAYALGALVTRRLGGLTGDTYGFICEGVETATFLVVAALPAQWGAWQPR
jgi:adenosylcobinamide-GDP ribazoletransferase